MREFHGISAKLYDYTLNWLMLGQERKIRRKVASLIPNKKLKILDAGCGTGSQLIEIKKNKKQAECYGIDASEDMLKIAKEKAKNMRLAINFSLQSFDNLKFKKNYFDYAVAFLALHEVPNDVREKAIQEIARVLKKNGKLIILDYVKTRGFAKLIQKLIFFTFREHKDFLKTKEELFKRFKKQYSKEVLRILSLDKYIKKD